VQKELERRITTEVERAQAEAQVKAAEELQKALTDARKQSSREKERIQKYFGRRSLLTKFCMTTAII